jgi:carbamoyl-phosphate synthase small subunit
MTTVRKSEALRGRLILETGEIYNAKMWDAFSTAGEVVFNTSHTGYEEMATDPSYYKQILVTTASHQGNYGVDPLVWESSQIHIRGFVCLQLQATARDQTWHQLLRKHKVPILSDLDTRALVLRLREGGTPWGAIVPANTEDEDRRLANSLIEESRHGERDWVYAVSRRSAEEVSGDRPDGPRVAVLDLGCKSNIVREVRRRSRQIKIFPARTPAQEILAWKPEGVVFSNGPGDPADVQTVVDTAQALRGKVFLFGICMGHQLLALSLGGSTYKLKYGHRGSNHPIRDDILKTIYVTSQNHGYAVDSKGLPTGVVITHRNLNDDTVAGLYWPEEKVFSVQFHPESCPGPHEAGRLFDFALEGMR